MNSILDNILHINLTNNFNSTFETEQRASSKGMMLTEEHWNVINFVKDVYHQSGFSAPTSRQLRNQLKAQFKDKGGNRYLYQLFPDGPIRTVSFLTGVPSQGKA